MSTISVTQTSFGRKVVTLPPQWLQFSMAASDPIHLWAASDQPAGAVGRKSNREIIATQLDQLHHYVYNKIVEALDDVSLTVADIKTSMNYLMCAMQDDAKLILAENFTANLKTMGSHLQFVQEASRMNVSAIIDDNSLFVSDIKQVIFEVFCGLQSETEAILHTHLVVVEGANEYSNAEMDRIEEMVRQMSAARTTLIEQQELNEELLLEDKAHEEEARH